MNVKLNIFWKIKGKNRDTNMSNSPTNERRNTQNIRYRVRHPENNRIPHTSILFTMMNIPDENFSTNPNYPFPFDFPFGSATLGDYDMVGVAMDVRTAGEVLYTMFGEVDRALAEIVRSNIEYNMGDLGNLLEHLPSQPNEELPRRENIQADISSQLYDTTEQKFDNCVICTKEYENTDTVSVLNCGHVFHPKCIEEWCKYKATCPLCKAGIPTKE